MSSRYTISTLKSKPGTLLHYSLSSSRCCILILFRDPISNFTITFSLLLTIHPSSLNNKSNSLTLLFSLTLLTSTIKLSLVTKTTRLSKRIFLMTNLLLLITSSKIATIIHNHKLPVNLTNHSSSLYFLIKINKMN